MIPNAKDGMMTEATEQEKALRLATEAGHVLLENGAAICPR